MSAMCQCPNRRQALGLFLGLLAGAPAANAADDLLDPLQLGRGARRATAGSDTTPRLRRHAELQVQGRGMASATVGTLETLTRVGADLVAQELRLLAQLKALGERLDRLSTDMAQQLAEYRDGLFCSGCNRTKSDIERNGERFPHPGHRIIQPTAEQIAAKERELKRPVDSTARDLEAAKAKRKRCLDEREQVLLQIDAGLALWRTSLSFEQTALLMDAQQDEARYRSDRAKADEQVNKLGMAASRAALQAAASTGKPGAEAAAAQAKQLKAELQFWQETLRDLEQRRGAELRRAQQEMAQATSAAQQESERLNGYLQRDGLRQVLSAVATPSLMAPTAGFNDLGGLYRQGNHDPARHDEVLPSVKDFVTRFQALPALACGAPSSCAAAAAATPAAPPPPAQPAAAGNDSLRRLIQLP
jgi:hypothetical protein